VSLNILSHHCEGRCVKRESSWPETDDFDPSSPSHKPLNPSADVGVVRIPSQVKADSPTNCLSHVPLPFTKVLRTQSRLHLRRHLRRLSTLRVRTSYTRCRLPEAWCVPRARARRAGPRRSQDSKIDLKGQNKLDLVRGRAEQVSQIGESDTIPGV